MLRRPNSPLAVVTALALAAALALSGAWHASGHGHGTATAAVGTVAHGAEAAVHGSLHTPEAQHEHTCLACRAGQGRTETGSSSSPFSPRLSSAAALLEDEGGQQNGELRQQAARGPPRV